MRATEKRLWERSSIALSNRTLSGCSVCLAIGLAYLCAHELNRIAAASAAAQRIAFGTVMTRLTPANFNIGWRWRRPQFRGTRAPRLPGPGCETQPTL